MTCPEATPPPRDVTVFQTGTGHHYTARCDCGWQQVVGSLKAAKTLAAEHRRDGCIPQPPAPTEPSPSPATSQGLVPAGPAGGLAPAGQWTKNQVRLLQDHMHLADASEDELRFFAQVCRHKDLDPFAGEVIATMRYDGKVKRKVLVIQETVAGLRTIAERTGLYGGQDEPLWCGKDKQWTDVWLADEPPAACKVRVYRKDWLQPCTGVATYASYVQLDAGGQPQNLWKSGPDFMLWKCAEAAALKRAFRRHLEDAGVNTREYTPPARASMEARLAGLDDDERHALVHRITDGRTDSTRDLDDEELLELRAEVARLAHTEGGVVFDPETGEIPPEQGGGPEEVDDAVVVEDLNRGSERDAPADNGAPTPDEAPPAAGPPQGHPMPRPKPGERQAVTDVKWRRMCLPDTERPEFDAWVVACGIPDSLDISDAKIAALNAELDRRGATKIDRPTGG